MNKKEFAKRRKQLMRMMSSGAIAILPAAVHQIRNRDAEYPYRQDSDFYYLTGFAEPESVAVLIPGRPQGEYILFCRERDPEKETWHGRRAGLEGATELYGADDAYPITDIDDILPGLMEKCERLYYTIGCSNDFDQRVTRWVKGLREKSRAGMHTPGEIVSLDHLLHDMRLYKSPAEMKLMREVASISSQAHIRAMQYCKPGMYEYQVEAELLYTFRRNGCVPSYNPIVGGGANGCILHYNENNAKLRAGDLLLIDAGGELDHYAADITRTFPVNGRFTPAQRSLYQLVLDAQYAAIEQVKPGNHWNDPHEAAVKVLTKGMVHLGLLHGKMAKLIEKQAYKRFYMHRTGHWLGMDVHDVGDYKVGEDWRILESGMVMTVEPGIYIPAGSSGVDEKWWDIGIRIEDDVLVTAEGCEVITHEAPKTVADIEAIMRNG